VASAEFKFAPDQSVVTGLQDVRVIGEYGGGMEDYEGLVFGVEALIRVALVVVEVVGDGYLGVQAAD